MQLINYILVVISLPSVMGQYGNSTTSASGLNPLLTSPITTSSLVAAAQVTTTPASTSTATSSSVTSSSSSSTSSTTKISTTTTKTSTTTSTTTTSTSSTSTSTSTTTSSLTSTLTSSSTTTKTTVVTTAAPLTTSTVLTSSKTSTTATLTQTTIAPVQTWPSAVIEDMVVDPSTGLIYLAYVTGSQSVQLNGKVAPQVSPQPSTVVVDQIVIHQVSLNGSVQMSVSTQGNGKSSQPNLFIDNGFLRLVFATQSTTLYGQIVIGTVPQAVVAMNFHTIQFGNGAPTFVTVASDQPLNAQIYCTTIINSANLFTLVVQPTLSKYWAFYSSVTGGQVQSSSASQDITSLTPFGSTSISFIGVQAVQPGLPYTFTVYLFYDDLSIQVSVLKTFTFQAYSGLLQTTAPLSKQYNRFGSKLFQADSVNSFQKVVSVQNTGLSVYQYSGLNVTYVPSLVYKADALKGNVAVSYSNSSFAEYLVLVDNSQVGVLAANLAVNQVATLVSSQSFVGLSNVSIYGQFDGVKGFALVSGQGQGKQFFVVPLHVPLSTTTSTVTKTSTTTSSIKLGNSVLTSTALAQTGQSSAVTTSTIAVVQTQITSSQVSQTQSLVYAQIDSSNSALNQLVLTFEQSSLDGVLHSSTEKVNQNVSGTQSQTLLTNLIPIIAGAGGLLLLSACCLAYCCMRRGNNKSAGKSVPSNRVEEGTSY